MKKIFFVVLIFISISPTIYAGVGSCSREEDCSTYLLEEQQKELELKINKLETENALLSTLQVQKIKLEKDIILLESDLSKLEIGTLEYTKKQLEILQAQRNYTQDIINLTKKTSCGYEGICMSVELGNLYQRKIIVLDEQINTKQKEIDENIEKEKQKIREEKELKLQQEKETKAQEYFISAEQKLKDGDIKSSIPSYTYSCSYIPAYICYYALGNVHFLQAQEYYKKISNYGYDRLYKDQKNKAIESLNKAYELSENEIQKASVNTLKSQVENYPNKEENIPQKVEKNTNNSQVEIIWSRIQKITSSYSEEEKQATYQLLITKLEEYINKSQDNDLKQMLSEIILRLKSETTQEEKIGVYDKSDKFYKKSLQKNTYSCEISATSDILSTLKNKNFTEDELIEKIDKSKFGETAKYSNGIYIWGNPNAGFVGYIDVDEKGNIASQRNLTGYGVYEAPIAKLYNDYGVKTEIINNSHYTTQFGPEQHLQKLLEQFTKGNYVQLWGDICTSPEYDDGELALADITQADVDNGKNAKNECWSFDQDRKRVWYYENGTNLTKHQGLIGEHNFYLLGYEGTIENPKNIVIWDTSTGKHTYPIKEWLRKWEEMDYRSIIIYSE